MHLLILELQDIYIASKKPTNGNRLDVGWQYGIDVDKNSRRVQCKYCQKIISGGIYRFKHHCNDFDECFRNNEEDKGNEGVFSLHDTPTDCLF